MVSNGSHGHQPRRTSRSNHGRAESARHESANTSRAAGDTDFVTTVIPSDFAASRELQHRIIQQVIHHGYSERNLFAIKLALEEAMINAIKHGNKLDMKKKVRVDYAVTPQHVELIIEDEGPGFHREQVPDPTSEENLCKCSGRGILLIEAYMSKVEYSKGGRASA